MSQTPTFSVVVGLISGRKADLRRCLTALRTQDIGQPVEIIVPYDDACAEVATLSADFPAVTFIRAAHLDTARARLGFGREHHDALRTIGLRATRGDVVALTEDHAHASPTWCREMLAAIDRHPRAAAIGGAVECDSDKTLNWAVWFCDFGRYQNPLPEGPAEFVSDSNVAYRRAALEAVAGAWQEDYHETAVHWAMTQAGFELRTTPTVVVWQARGELGLGNALKERFVWARSFAGTRARVVGSPKRWVYAILSPLLPFVMTWRVFRITLQRGAHTRRCLTAMPLIAMLQTAWAAGELVGYVTAKATAKP